MEEGQERFSAGQFVERFASVMTQAGMPRMPARVFARLLAEDEGACTAAELAESLQASPAAISGATRYLTQVRLVAKDRLPGERRDTYRLYNKVWYEVMGSRDEELARWSEVSREGVVAVGPDTAAGQRLDETARFFDFLRTELAGLMERWRQLQQG
jgi:DNA-binding transcriptional regulator GbsR (MarR family)